MTGKSYLQTRNFSGLPLQKYQYRKTYNLISPAIEIAYRLRRKPNPFAGNIFFGLGPEQPRLLHFFNTINFGRTPWVVSFSDFVPRWRINTEQLEPAGMRRLAGSACKQLITLSQCSYESQQRLMEPYTDLRDQITAKMRIMHPAQALLVQDYAEKRLDESALVMTIVGGDFFRKGGMEILRAFDVLTRQNYDLRLNIVSSLAYGDYASRATREAYDEALGLIERYSDRIVHYQYLDNDRVLDLFRQSHIGLLPTYDDTYGYSALEAQAAGCPVISSDIRVMPEINSSQYGWIIPVPKDEWGQGFLTTAVQRQRFSAILVDGLIETIKDAVEHPDKIRNKGERCLERIRCHHSPERNAAELEALYDRILSGAL